jgi:formate hydrogenlyase subunit 3/multisubunit Na+/H+ antiporter MnhD subunit
LSPAALLLLAATLLCALAIAAPVVVGRRPTLARPIVYGGSAILCGGLLVVALTVLLFGSTPAPVVVLPIGLPLTGAHFTLDPLAAFFLAIVDGGGLAASLYALGYGRHERHPGRVLPFFPAFLAGMNLVVGAADAFAFLISWEFMSLASWALVVADHRDPDSRQAAWIYLVMAGFGTLMLLLAFGLLAGADGAYVFAEMRGHAHADWVGGVVLVLMLLGAGSKAGLVPLHVWLPLAHPAAPSHVSALMSGVMTKVAIYGFVRVVFDLVGEPAWWWSLVVLALGAATAVLGILHAVMERDLKRLLAYSTVENVGIVFVGLGLALAFSANGMRAAAALALIAALFHAVNHAMFKSTLFFGAGAVLVATGKRDIEALGGLVHRMPHVAWTFLGACLAIAALPPLNGFVSEWLILQAILLSPALPQWGLKIAVPAVGALLAFAAALAATCFVRAFGITFLGRPRSPQAAAAEDGDRWTTGVMKALLVLCLFAGILPNFVIDALAPVARGLLQAAMPPQPLLPHLSIVPISESRSSYSGLLVFLFVVISTRLAVRVIHDHASRELRRAPPWDCGAPDPSPATQYTASSFAQPLRRVFGPMVFRSKITSTMPEPGDPAPAKLVLSQRDLVWEILYAPLAGLVTTIAGRLNTLQFLTIRSYLSLVFAALVGLLLMVATWA